MIYVGIDCGRLGAISWMRDDRTGIEIHDTPLTPEGDYDLFAAWELVARARANGPALVVIEDTISVPHAEKAKPGTPPEQIRRYIASSERSLHASLGAWRMACASFRLPVVLVHPKTWKASVLQGVPNDPHAEALALKGRLADKVDPAIFHGKKGKLMDGRVDALWLCEYARAQHRTGAIVVDLDDQAPRVGEIEDLRQEALNLRVALGLALAEKHGAIARLREVASLADRYQQEAHAPNTGESA